MRVLIDTHVLLWTLREPDRLRPSAKAVLADPAIVTVVSAVVVWEIAIKQSLGKLRAPEDLMAVLRTTDHEILAIQAADVWRVRDLPPHHGDPFDRLLIAQAQVENLPILTHDSVFERYDVQVIRA